MLHRTSFRQCRGVREWRPGRLTVINGTAIGPPQPGFEARNGLADEVHRKARSWRAKV